MKPVTRAGVRGVLAGVACVLALRIQASTQSVVDVDATMALFTRYVSGDLTGASVLPRDLTLDRVSKALPRLTERIPFTPGLDGLESRSQEDIRHLVAAFGLEVAGANVVNETDSASDILNWVRRTQLVPPNDAFAHDWRHVEIALFESIHAPDLEKGVDDALLEFPGDPRFTLARAVASEQQLIAQLDDDAHADNGRIAETIRRLNTAAAIESTRGEAELRLGHVELRLGRYTDALGHLDAALKHVSGQDLVFLAHFLRGKALVGLHRLDDAEVAFQSALDAAPRAGSAVLALSAVNFERGDRDRANSLTTNLMTNWAAADPWHDYAIGDGRMGDALLVKLRAHLK